MKSLSLLLLFMTASVIGQQDTLLTLSKSNSCLRDLVTSFVRADDCASLSDEAKTKLALQMSSCLLKSMGKPLPQSCLSNPSSCKLQGDGWSTFTTFFAHLDNLCHFYWQTLHHQRAQRLIGQLSQSSSLAQSVLRQNVEQTRKILSMQDKMHSSLLESINSQQEMSQLINSSSQRLSKLTTRIETFVQKIHQDIQNNYASISNVLAIINQGILQIVELQGYIKAEIYSVYGIAFYIAWFITLLFITSFQKYHLARNKLITLLVAEILIELLLAAVFGSVLNLKALRYLFIAIMAICLINDGHKNPDVEDVIASHLSTPRLQRVFRKAAMEQRRGCSDKLWASRLMFQSCQQGRRVQELYNEEKQLFSIE